MYSLLLPSVTSRPTFPSPITAAELDSETMEWNEMDGTPFVCTLTVSQLVSRELIEYIAEQRRRKRATEAQSRSGRVGGWIDRKNSEMLGT